MRIIDSRESKERKEAFAKEGFAVQALSSGDFRLTAYGGRVVGIEYKNDADLVASLRVDKPDKSCRLERELWRLKAEVDYPLLLLGGTYLCSKDGSLIGGGFYVGYRKARSFTSIQNLLLSVELNGVIVVPLPVPSQSQLVRSVLAIEENFLKSHHLFGLPQLVSAKRLELLISIDGIDSKLAHHLLEVLGMEKVLTGSEEELRICPGIGKLKAQKIVEWRQRFLG